MRDEMEASGWNKSVQSIQWARQIFSVFLSPSPAPLFCAFISPLLLFRQTFSEQTFTLLPFSSCSTGPLRLMPRIWNWGRGRGQCSGQCL